MRAFSPSVWRLGRANDLQQVFATHDQYHFVVESLGQMSALVGVPGALICRADEQPVVAFLLPGGTVMFAP